MEEWKEEKSRRENGRHLEVRNEEEGYERIVGKIRKEQEMNAYLRAKSSEKGRRGKREDGSTVKFIKKK